MTTLKTLDILKIDNALSVNYANARGRGEITISFTGSDLNHYEFEVQMDSPDAHNRGFDEAQAESYVILDCMDSDNNDITPPDDIDYLATINKYLEFDTKGFELFTEKCYDDLIADEREYQD